MLTLIILASVAIAVLVLAAFIASRPAEFRISRCLAIHAPAAAVFPFVNDLREHARWSPFRRQDPGTACAYDGPAEGKGSSLRWNGNKKAGEGRMTIVDSQPDTRVVFSLEFVRPFRATNEAELTFEALDNGDTLVTWTVSGRKSFTFKAMGLFMDCDKMCGGEFEKGLAQLKTLSENTPALVLSLH